MCTDPEDNVVFDIAMEIYGDDDDLREAAEEEVAQDEEDN